MSHVVGLPDGVAGPQSNPLWYRSVLLRRFCELLLGPEGLVGLRGLSVFLDSLSW